MKAARVKPSAMSINSRSSSCLIRRAVPTFPRCLAFLEPRQSHGSLARATSAISPAVLCHSTLFSDANEKNVSTVENDARM